MASHAVIRRSAARILMLLCVVGFATGPAAARDWYVDNCAGSDDADGAVGAPLRTINVAVRRAAPGDTIHLVANAAPYRQMAVFHNRSGQPGNPITLDGHGATLSGSEPLDPAAWELVERGLYRSSTLQPPNPAIIGRYFFVFDGQMNRMGRSSKGPRPAYRRPEDLEPGEWTWVADEEAFYVRTPGDRPLDECDIAAPMRANGVALSGKCEHLVIRNLTATHVWNDGYNIHGASDDVVFENIRAIECGDDGISAHGQCDIQVRGMVSIGNSTGMCHGDNANSRCEGVYIQGCHGYAYYVLHSGTHVLRNSWIVCDAAQSVVVVGAREPPGSCTLKLENVVLEGGERAPALHARQRSVLEMSRVTVFGLSMLITGEIFKLGQSIIGGTPKPTIIIDAQTSVEADANLYDLAQFKLGGSEFAREQFEDYRAATGQDGASVWSEFAFGEPFTGQLSVPVDTIGATAELSELREGARRR